MSPRRVPRTALAGVTLIAGIGLARADTPPKVTDLGAFPGYSTVARGINDAGDIVGEKYRSISDTSRESHGLVWRRDASGQYVATEIGGLPDFPNTYPRAINNASRIAGWSEVVDSGAWAPPAQAVMWEKDARGVFYPTDLGTPYGFWYSETAIFNEGGHPLNEKGQIAGGACVLPSWEYHARLWTNPPGSPPTDLSPAADERTYTKAYGVNGNGIVVGEAKGNPPTGWFQKAVLWQKDAAGNYSETDLPLPVGGKVATAYDINDTGLVVGVVDGRAVAWEPADPAGYEAVYLETPPGTGYGRALAVNNAGDIIGWAIVSESGTNRTHAMLWQRDPSDHFLPTDLGGLSGFTSSFAYGINERGQIVGQSNYPDPDTGANLIHGVLWETADSTPPVITNARVDPSVLWPPNHKLVNIRVDYDATDDSGSVTCGLEPVRCNEPITPADWRLLDEHYIELRSERLGKGPQRVYTIVITCADPSNNVASSTVIVTVPHDQRR
jgi:uncharacterized membrane protein